MSFYPTLPRGFLKCMFEGQPYTLDKDGNIFLLYYILLYLTSPPSHKMLLLQECERWHLANVDNKHGNP